MPSNTPKYVCHSCRNKIPVVDLEGVFHEQIKNFFFSPEEIAAHVGKAHAVIKEKEELLSTLYREQKKLAAEVDLLYDLYQSGAIDKHGFGAKYHPLATRQRQLEDEIPQVQAELDVLKISHLSQEEIVTSARDLYSRWPELPHEEKRRIVEVITDRIIIHEGEVEMNLFYAPPASTPGMTPPTSQTPPTPSTPPLNDGGMATKLHGRVAFLPYVAVTLKALRRKEFDFDPKTLGEHIKKRRLELKLTQKEVAARLKVNAWTVLNWEKGETQPLPQSVPKIILFLGYDPMCEA